MTSEEAIRGLIVAGLVEAIQGLVEAGIDSDAGLGRAYLAAQGRQANATEETQKFMKGHDEMETTETALLGLAKGVVAGDQAYGLTRQDFEAGIDRIAKRIRVDGETEAQSFTRAMTETEEGRLLFKASKYAPGAEPKQPDEPEEPASREPAHDRMQALADRYHAANPHLSAARAYSDVYSARENSDLRARVIGEQLSPKPRTPAGRTAVGRNPNWNADVRATMARTL